MTVLGTHGAPGCRIRAQKQLALALTFVAAVLSACHSSPSVSTAPPAQRPLKYHVLYRREEHDGSQTRVVWQDLSVIRPLLSRDARYSERPTPGAQPFGGTLALADELFTFGPDGAKPVTARPPAPPTGDQELGMVIRQAVDRHEAKPIGTTRVLGRPCRIVLLAEPPAGPLAALPSDTGAEHDDICLGDDGLVLREQWIHGGKLLLERDAVLVDDNITRDTSHASTATPPAGGVRLRAPGAASLQPPTAPAGFTAVDPLGVDYPPLQGSPPVSSVVWAFTRDVDLLTVETGATAPTGPPWSSLDVTKAADIAGWRYAATVVRSDGSEVRGQLENGAWVVVRSTRSPGFTLAYAKTLRATPS